MQFFLVFLNKQRTFAKKRTQHIQYLALCLQPYKPFRASRPFPASKGAVNTKAATVVSADGASSQLVVCPLCHRRGSISTTWRVAGALSKRTKKCSKQRSQGWAFIVHQISLRAKETGFFQSVDEKIYADVLQVGASCLLPPVVGLSFQMKALPLHPRSPLDKGHVHSRGTDTVETPSVRRLILPPVNCARECCAFHWLLCKRFLLSAR